MRFTKLIFAAIGVLLAVALPPATASAARDDIQLVSRASGVDGAAGDGNSGIARISADGRFVVFESDASTLSGDDVDGVQDVFRRDMVTGETVLISRADGVTGPGGDESSDDATISADGRYVAFESYADNLGGIYNTSYLNIFVRDLEGGTTTVVASGNERSEDPSISTDGRYVAFTSLANDIHADDTDGKADVFVRDRQTGDLELASRAGGATGPGGDDSSYGPMLSADGRHVAFESSANNLVDGEVETVTNAFVRDLDPDTTQLVSRADGAGGTPADKTSSYLAISADGGKVAFSSSATNLSDDDGDPFNDVFLRDRTAVTTQLVSRAAGATGAAGDAGSSTPSLSADGRFVSFESDATNFSEAHGPFGDVFVRDMVAGRTILASRAAGPDGAGADKSAGTYGTAISADGRFVTFESDATNLSDADADGVADVFRRDVLGTAPACDDVTQDVAHGTPVDRAAAVHGRRRRRTRPSDRVRAAPRDGVPGRRCDGHGGLPPGRGLHRTGLVHVPCRRRELHGPDRHGDPDGGPGAGSGRRRTCRWRPAPARRLRRGAPRHAPGEHPARHGRRRSPVGPCGQRRPQRARRPGLPLRRRRPGRLTPPHTPSPARLAGGPGNDALVDRRGADRFSGGAGNDRIDARDRRLRDRRRRDRISCGPGRADRVQADRRDRVAKDCELDHVAGDHRVACPTQTWECERMAAR